MGFYDTNLHKIIITPCSNKCICKNLLGHEAECEIKFAGFSKNHNQGLHYKNKFYTEKLAESWDGKVHDYHVTVKRNEVVSNSIIIKQLIKLQHPNLMKLFEYCDCSVDMEYLPGKLLNAKKPDWLLGKRSGENDYLDDCTYEELLHVFLQVGDALQYLHLNNICHTDPIDHNVIVLSDGTAKLIDLLGAMELNEELLQLDNYVFLNRLVLPLSYKKNKELPEYIKKNIELEGKYNLKELLYQIKNIIV